MSELRSQNAERRLPSPCTLATEKSKEGKLSKPGIEQLRLLTGALTDEHLRLDRHKWITDERHRFSGEHDAGSQRVWTLLPIQCCSCFNAFS